MDIRRAFRKAVTDRLTGDAKLANLSGGSVQVTYRPTRKVGTFSTTQKVAITFFDTADRADDSVPLLSRSLQVDVWCTGGLDMAEKVAARIVLLLEGTENQGVDPLTLPDDSGLTAPGLVAHVSHDATVDGWEQDADLDRITLTFTALVYQYPEGDV